MPLSIIAGLGGGGVLWIKICRQVITRFRVLNQKQNAPPRILNTDEWRELVVTLLNPSQQKKERKKARERI